ATPQTATSRLSDLRPGNRRKAAAPTVVLLVRHGATTTTGRELPGRAPGLHLSDAGREQAERVATRIARTAGLDPQATPDGSGAGTDGETAGRRSKGS